MKRELEIKYRSILREQRNRKVITARHYNNEIELIKKLKQNNENKNRN